MVRIFRVVLALMLFSLSLAYPAVVQAEVTATHIFTADEGVWSLPENWTPEDVPGYPNYSGDVNYKSDIPQILPFRTVNLAGIVTVSGLDIGQGSTLNIADSSKLTVLNNPQIQNPHIQNDGDIYLLGKNSLFSVPQGATFSGRGTLTLNGGFLLTSPHDPPYTTVNGDYHTIKGNGDISSLVNKGLVVARGGELWLHNVSNQGVVGQLNAEGENSSLNFWAGYTVTGGSINLFDGATANFQKIFLSNIILTGSEFSNDKFNFLGSPTLQNVTLAGGLVNLNGAVSLKGTNINKTTTNVNSITTFIKDDNGSQPKLINDGTVYVGSTGYAYFNMGEDTEVTFEGTGKVVLLPPKDGAAGPNSLKGPPSSKYINEAGHTIQGAGDINTAIENRGNIVAENGTLNINGSVTGNGNVAIAADATLHLNRTLQTGNFAMSRLASLDVGDNCAIDLKGNFSFSQTNESRWTWRSNTGLRMSGGGPLQALEIGGKDFGENTSGFDGNFHLANLTITDTNTYVYLMDAIDNGNRGAGNAHEVLYVENLLVCAGATLNLNGFDLYVDIPGYSPHLLNTWVGDMSWLGGGTIINQPVPLPCTLLLLGSGLLGLGLYKRRKLASSS
jgi:hypothetical protein